MVMTEDKEMVSEGFVERLLSLKPNDQPLSKFLAVVDCQIQNVKYWKAGHYPTIRRVEKIADRLHVNPGWLAYGVGENQSN